MTISFISKEKSYRPLWIFSFVVAAILIGFYLCTLYHYNTESNSYQTWLTILWLATTLVFIAIINFLLNAVLNRFLSWKSYPIWRFFVQMIIGTGLSLVIINLGYNLIKSQFTAAPPSANQIILMNIYGATLLLPLFSFFFGFKFLRAWRKADLESERLQKENARSQMMNLKNHLDPHFLFNNLNILSSLIEKDSQLSREYLDRFAEVYRIILKSEYSDLTTLSEEIKLIQSYIYLIQIRFEDSVFFDIDMSTDAGTKALPPLSIQMLIENAIKHNIATKEKPLTIKVRDSQDYIEIENNKQVKKYMRSERKATGLDNIKNRYEFFTDIPVRIDDNDNFFSVRLPLLEIEE